MAARKTAPHTSAFISHPVKNKQPVGNRQARFSGCIAVDTTGIKKYWRPLQAASCCSPHLPDPVNNCSTALGDSTVEFVRGFLQPDRLAEGLQCIAAHQGFGQQFTFDQVAVAEAEKGFRVVSFSRSKIKVHGSAGSGSAGFKMDFSAQQG